MGNKLILMNGRGYRKNTYLYIGAYSKEEAYRLLVSIFPYTTRNFWKREIRDYFNIGVWGIAMKDIEPQKGVWELSNHYGNNSVLKRLQ